MNICFLQHAAYEGPGEIGAWAALHGHPTRIHHLYGSDPVPSLDSFDLLVVMGGEMNIYQDRDWPWLKAERAFIKSSLEIGKPVIGICLGAQFIADALGSRVVQNPEYEIGWFPANFTGEARTTFPGLPCSATVLHWHGDTFGLPPGATRLAFTTACPEQGFMIKDKCLGLQFHLEVDPSLARQYVESQGHWPSGRFVQKPETIVQDAANYCETNKRALRAMLDRFCKNLT